MSCDCDIEIAAVEGLRRRFVASGQQPFDPAAPIRPCREDRPSMDAGWSDTSLRPRVGPA